MADEASPLGVPMIKLIKSSFYHEAETKEQLAKFIIDSPIFSMGEQCRNFEVAFAKKQERQHAVYVANGSVANLILIQALLNMGIFKPGDKIGFSALTWATNIMPLIQLGLVPVAIDCEKDTLNVSPETLQPYLGEIKGLFLTNVLGFADDIEAITKLCQDNKIVFIEDNCESLGSRINGKLLGNFGLASTFSFYIGHHMSTIEGGMVCTDDADLADMLKLVRAHGWDRNLSPEKQQQLRQEHGIDGFYARYTFYDIATNVRPTEINGFIGNTQLPYLDEIIEKRVSNFNRFNDAIKANADFLPLDIEHMELVSNFAMPVICKDELTFTKYLERFEAAEVEIRPIIAGDMTKQPFYKKYVTDDTATRENAAFIHQHGFYFGNNPEMTEEELSTLVGLLAA